MSTQLSLFEEKTDSSVIENPGEISITEFVIETQNPAILRFLHRDKSLGGKGHVNEYFVGKSQNHYFRYSYRLGNKTRHKHIPGGNTWSVKAQKRAQVIQQMIDRDAPTVEILEMISCFK